MTCLWNIGRNYIKIFSLHPKCQHDVSGIVLPFIIFHLQHVFQSLCIHNVKPEVLNSCPTDLVVGSTVSGSFTGSFEINRFVAVVIFNSTGPEHDVVVMAFLGIRADCCFLQAKNIKFLRGHEKNQTFFSRNRR